LLSSRPVGQPGNAKSRQWKRLSRGLHRDPPRPKLMTDNQAWESQDGLDYSDT
jgi:hypothetical protein